MLSNYFNSFDFILFGELYVIVKINLYTIEYDFFRNNVIRKIIHQFSKNKHTVHIRLSAI